MNKENFKHPRKHAILCRRCVVGVFASLRSFTFQFQYAVRGSTTDKYRQGITTVNVTIKRHGDVKDASETK